MLDMLGRGGRADIIGGPGKEGKEGREAVSLESLRPPQSSQNPYLHLTSSSLPVAHPLHYYSMASEAVQTQLISIQSMNFFPPAEAAASLTSFPILNFLPGCRPTAALSASILITPIIDSSWHPCQLQYRKLSTPCWLSIANYHIGNKHHHNTGPLKILLLSTPKSQSL